MFLGRSGSQKQQDVSDIYHRSAITLTPGGMDHSGQGSHPAPCDGPGTTVGTQPEGCCRTSSGQ